MAVTGSSTRSSTSSPSTRTSSAVKSKSAAPAKAAGANPTLANAVKSINISQYRAKNGVTYCNLAANAYAKKLGYNGFQGLTAKQINAKISKPGSGWRKATADEAMAAAAKGKLTVASWTGKAHGHISAVIGEYAKGVPAIAQAGGHVKNGKTVDNTFEYGPITRTRANPTYFVRD